MGEPGDGAGANVLCVPEFTFYEKMFPFDGFADVYEGNPADRTWIMFSHNGQAYDEIAASGATGLDPNLVKGLPVKPGQRVIVLLPALPPTASKPSFLYSWLFIWRIRNLFDFRNARTTRYNYSLPLQGQGVPDTTGPNPGARVVIPAVNQCIVYNQAEPTALWWSPQVDHLRSEEIENRALPAGFPLMPDGTEGTVQQGVMPSTQTGYRMPWFGVHELQAIGDELLIALHRTDDAAANWEFGAGGEDVPMVTFLKPPISLFALVARGVSP